MKLALLIYTVELGVCLCYGEFIPLPQQLSAACCLAGEHLGLVPPFSSKSLELFNFSPLFNVDTVQKRVLLRPLRAPRHLLLEPTRNSECFIRKSFSCN